MANSTGCLEDLSWTVPVIMLLLVWENKSIEKENDYQEVKFFPHLAEVNCNDFSYHRGVAKVFNINSLNIAVFFKNV